MKKNNSSNLASCKLYVKGMHCAACEVLVEKELLKHENIESANVSLKDNKVIVYYGGDKKPTIDLINNSLKKYGYQLSYNEIPKQNQKFFKSKNGFLEVNRHKLNNLIKILAVLILLFILFFVFENLHLGQYININSTSTLPAFFLLGFIAGLSTCAALVGGLLLSMVKQWNELFEDSSSISEKAKPHIMFHTGRFISFAILGGVLGIIGSTVSLNNLTIFSILTIIVSIIMFVLALQMLGVRSAYFFQLSIPKAITRFAANEQNFKGKYMPFVTGALTFFLPCGFTLIAQTIALASGSFVQGSLIMIFFSLGTFPMLAGISFSGLKLNTRPNLTAQFNTIAGIVVIFFALYNINGQLNVLGMPSLNDLFFKNKTQVTSQQQISNEIGEQVINIIAEGFSYIPTSSTTLKSGIPAVMLIENKGVDGCGAFVTARGLFDGYKQLAWGQNKIYFTPQKGTYKLTCSMGMVPPVTITVI